MAGNNKLGGAEFKQINCEHIISMKVQYWKVSVYIFCLKSHILYPWTLLHSYGFWVENYDKPVLMISQKVKQTWLSLEDENRI